MVNRGVLRGIVGKFGTGRTDNDALEAAIELTDCLQATQERGIKPPFGPKARRFAVGFAPASITGTSGRFASKGTFRNRQRQ